MRAHAGAHGRVCRPDWLVDDVDVLHGVSVVQGAGDDGVGWLY